MTLRSQGLGPVSHSGTQVRFSCLRLAEKTFVILAADSILYHNTLGARTRHLSKVDRGKALLALGIPCTDTGVEKGDAQERQLCGNKNRVVVPSSPSLGEWRRPIRY